MNEKVLKRSKLHVCRLAERADFQSRMTQIVGRREFTVSDGDDWRPRGTLDRKEYGLVEFCSKSMKKVWPTAANDLHNWWARYHHKPPPWDLIATCNWNKEPGLLLVEAKAHVDELDPHAKPPHSGSAKAEANLRHIRSVLARTTASIENAQDLRPINLSTKHHYQLSTQVTWAWKAASSELPVVLLYLGFVGDTSVKDYFHSAEHWECHANSYINHVLPWGFVGRTHKVGSRGRFTILVRAAPVGRRHA